MRMKGRILYIPFVSDTDFRLQLSTLHQLFGSPTQSSRDRRYFSAFTGMYLLLALHQNTGKSLKINNHSISACENLYLILTALQPTLEQLNLRDSGTN